MKVNATYLDGSKEKKIVTDQAQIVIIIFI